MEDEVVLWRIEEARAEIDLLRDAVIRLTASVMWERSAAAMAVAMVTQHSATTESELAVSSDEESSDENGPPWSRASGTPCMAEVAAVAKSVVGDRPPGIAKFSACGDGTEGSRVGVCGDGHRRVACWSLRRWHRRVACWSLRRSHRRITCWSLCISLVQCRLA